MEQCADQANAKLSSEVLGLQDTLTALREKLEVCSQTRAQLVSARARLLQDIRTKELSINIDSGKCMTARIEYPHNQRYLVHHIIDTLTQSGHLITQISGLQCDHSKLLPEQARLLQQVRIEIFSREIC